MTTRQRILDALASGQATIAELAAVITDRKTVTIDGVLRDLHREGMVRVADWHRNIGTRGRLSPVWSMKIGMPDKRKPKVPDDRRRRYQEKNLMRIAARSHKLRHGTVPVFYALMYAPRQK